MHSKNANGPIVWITGLSGAGKTTLAEALQAELQKKDLACVVLDGDIIRKTINTDLGFDKAARAENVRRIGAMAQMVALSKVAVVVGCLSPYRTDREKLKTACAADNIPFFEIYLDTPLAVCQARDPKGLYAQARDGTLTHLTGVDDPYEPPLNPALMLDTSQLSVAECVGRLIALLDA